jgi:hypothetical protein
MKRIVLRKEFQKEIFEELLNKFSRYELAKLLDTTSSSIYHMKNYKINSIRIDRFEKIKKQLQLSEKEITKNTLKIIPEEEVFKNLDMGRKFRADQLKTWKS